MNMDDRTRTGQKHPAGDEFGIHPVFTAIDGLHGAFALLNDENIKLLLFSGKIVCEVDARTMNRTLCELSKSHVDQLRYAGVLSDDDADLTEMRILK